MHKGDFEGLIKMSAEKIHTQTEPSQVDGKCPSGGASFLAQYKDLRGYDLLKVFLLDLYPGDLALVSSFGAESAVLLHMVSEIAPDTPVVFLETGKLFQQTLSYKAQLIDVLGLTNVQSAYPNAGLLGKTDPKGTLWQDDPDACCNMRKVLPLQEALRPFSGWITGRKRYQSDARQSLSAIEQDSYKLKLNPLVDFSHDDIKTYFKDHNLPQHPLVRQGYASIGCEVCTSKPTTDDPRSGRWAHKKDKTECGIHFIDGRIVRSNNN